MVIGVINYNNSKYNNGSNNDKHYHKIILRLTRIMITSNNREYHSFLQLTHKLPDNQK